MHVENGSAEADPLTQRLQPLRPEERDDFIRQAQTGDTEAIVPVLRHFDYLISGQAARLDNYEDQRECTSEIHLNVIKGLGSFSVGTRDTDWLFTIAKNTAMDYYKSLTRRDPESPDPKARIPRVVLSDPKHLDEILRDEPAAAYDEPHSMFERSDATRRALRLLNLLTPEQAEVVRLRRFEDLTIQESAERLGVTPNVVKALLHRAEARLRRAYEEGLIDIDLDSRTINS